MDYGSCVFPAEACDTIGGEASDVEMFPEVKPVVAVNGTRKSLNIVYTYYRVFPGEACDGLGGEFCEPDYQNGVFEGEAISR